jgi:DNA gyrase/topoisomerase IV subunit A
LRVASALFDLPEIAQAFQKGDFSYSKARALTRVANAKTEAHLLDFALKANAAHVDRHCFELRNAQRTVSTRDANRINNRRYLSYVPSTDGSVCISLELPKETADLVLKALELAAAQLKPADAEYLENGCTSSELSEIDEGGSREPSVLQQQQVDALVEMARGYLAGSDSVESDGSRTSCTADHYQVTVHVDERALRGATTPENLVMLCSAHHRLLHEGGLEIKAGPDGRWQFRRLATP